MRSAKTVSVTIPPEMLSRAEKLAKRENRTMSELVREALRHYERQRWWENTRAYGRARAAVLGVKTEGDVVRVIHEYRQQRGRKKRPGA